MPNQIKTVEDVMQFALQLVSEGLNFHPDDDFADCIHYDSGEPMYSPEESERRNELMTQCFDVCTAEHKDVYSIMGDVFLAETRLNQFIPLST